MTFRYLQNSLVLICAVLALVAGPAMAQEQPPAEVIEKLKAEDQKREDERLGRTKGPIVVELFTTSDCSACVFSDRMMYDTMNEPNVIALSCHIKDLSELRKQEKDFAGQGSETYKGPMDPCVFRQWSYRLSRSSDVLLNIPTFIINGQEHVDGENPAYYSRTLASYRVNNKNKAVDVFMKWKDADTITIGLPQKPETSHVTSASVWIIRYKDMAVEKIDAGINKGRVLRFSNIIQSIKHVGKWHGTPRTLDIDVEKPQGGKERGGYVILVQEMMGEPVLAAGKLADYPTGVDRKAEPRTAPAPAAKQ